MTKGEMRLMQARNEIKGGALSKAVSVALLKHLEKVDKL